MWNVFIKEIKEGWPIVLFLIILLVMAPLVILGAIPESWQEDVLGAFRVTMLLIILPLALSFTAIGLVQQENNLFLKALPVPPWKIAVGKLMFVSLCFVIVESLLLAQLDDSLLWLHIFGPWWTSVGNGASIVHFARILVAATAILVFASFALATFFGKRSYPIVLAVILTLCGIFVPAQNMNFYQAFLLDEPTIATGIIFFFIACAGCIYLYHLMIHGLPRRWIGLIVYCGLMALPGGIFFMRQQHWAAIHFLGRDPDRTELHAIGPHLLIGRGQDWHFHLYDTSTEELQAFHELTPFDTIRGCDPERGIIYYTAGFAGPEGKEGQEALEAKVRAAITNAAFRQIVAIQDMEAKEGISIEKNFLCQLDLRSSKQKQIGVYPGRLRISGDTLSWFVEDKPGSQHPFRYFGFESLTTGTSLSYTMEEYQDLTVTRNGPVLMKRENGINVFSLANLATGELEELTRGPFEFVREKNWNLHQNNSWAYLREGTMLITLDPTSANLLSIGEWDLAAEWAPGAALLYRPGPAGRIQLAFWKDGAIVKEQLTPFDKIWILDKGYGNRIIFNALSDGVWANYITDKDSPLQYHHLPKDTTSSRFLASPENLILWRGQPTPSDESKGLLRAYGYDLSKGRLRRLS